MQRKPFLVALFELFAAYWPHIDVNWHRRWQWLLPTPGNVIFTLTIVAALFWAQSAGAIPMRTTSNAAFGTIAYQGRLADAAGIALNDRYSMGFRLYASNAADVVPLWTEEWTGTNSVIVSDGLFNVMLGSLTPISQETITANDSLFLGITVGNDDEMSPRIQLGSVPFAVQALTVSDGSVTADKIADGAVTQEKLGSDVNLVPPDGSVTSAKLASQSVTSAKMAPGAANQNLISNGHIVLSPDANKLVKISVVENSNGIVAYKNNQVIVKGWGFITGTGANRTILTTVNYGITFAESPIVTHAYIGETGSTPTSIASFQEVGGNSTITSYSRNVGSSNMLIGVNGDFS